MKTKHNKIEDKRFDRITRAMEWEKRQPHPPEQHSPQWYEANTGNHQGLIIDETTGENIAVVYDKANTAYIVKAANEYPKLKTLKERDQARAQRDELLAAAKAWERARKDGGISMADLYESAWQQTQAAIARCEASSEPKITKADIQTTGEKIPYFGHMRRSKSK